MATCDISVGIFAWRYGPHTRRAEQIEAIDVVRKAQELGPSYMMSIKEKLGVIGTVPFVEIQVGPRQPSFVALVRQKRLEGVEGRAMLAQRVAQTALAQLT